MIDTGLFIVSIKNGAVESNFWVWSWGFSFHHNWLLILYKLIKTSVDVFEYWTTSRVGHSSLCVCVCVLNWEEVAHPEGFCVIGQNFLKVVKHLIPLWEEGGRGIYLLHFPEDIAGGGGTCFGMLAACLLMTQQEDGCIGMRNCGWWVHINSTSLSQSWRVLTPRLILLLHHCLWHAGGVRRLEIVWFGTLFLHVCKLHW